MKYKIENYISIAIIVGFIIVVVVAVGKKVREDNLIDETSERTESELIEQITLEKQSIESKYKNIEIHYDNWEKSEDFKYNMSDNKENILKGLEEIEKVLERLPSGMIEETLDTRKGKYESVYGNVDEHNTKIIIILCSTILEANLNQNGLMRSEHLNKTYNIYISVDGKKNIGQCLAHELYHVFQCRISMQNLVEEFYTQEEWKRELPDKFSYYQTAVPKDDKYTILTENNMENVYFVSSYSKVGDEEDKCELFSYLLSTDEKSDLPRAYKSSHVKKRVKMILEEIDEYFDTVDENAYWNKIYNEKVLNY